MSASPGTLELVAMELSKLLRPLEDELASAAQAKPFLASMGFLLDDGQVGSLSGEITAVANDVNALIGIVEDLIQAIDNEDLGTITSKGIAGIQKIADVLNNIKPLSNQIAVHVGISGTEVARRVFDFLLFRYLEGAQGFNDLLELLGLLAREDHNEDSVDPANPPFTVTTYHYDQIGNWFSDPSGQIKSLYGWGNDNFTGKELFAKVQQIVSRTGAPVVFDDSNPAAPVLDVVIVEITPKTDVTPHGLQLLIKNNISSGPQTIPLGTDAQLVLTIDAATPSNTGLAATPDGHITFQPPSPASSISGEFSLQVIAQRTDPPEPFILFGQTGASRLEMGKFTLTTGVTLTWDGSKASGDFLLQADADAMKIVIDTTSGDGFLSSILPSTKMEADFSIQMGVSTSRGFYFSGSSALQVRLPAHIDLGPVSIEALTVGAKLDSGKIPISVGADIKAALGPLTGVVQNMGVTATFSFPPNNSGNLGPLQFDIGFKPPDGIGLSIDTGVIKGGGFLSLNFDAGEYFGALELSFEDVITLKAVGIINTKMPDGSKGFALLILVTAEFTPIQLGFGFTLIGVGGLLALNRSLDTEALRTGVRTGAVNSILFPQDIVANISKIISDLKTVFPIVEGHFVIGPMGKLGWGTPTLISLEIGVILDIPQAMFVILGVLQCLLPSEDVPILQLQVNFAGGIDFSQGLIWFDASLFDSRLLIYTLTGDMALRIGWGTQAIFVLSVGGFHPAFNEIPPDLRSMKRMSISLLSGDNPRLTVQTYFAVTSNSVQSGARVELYAAAGGFNIYGFMGYDLLVQFNPFHFIADIGAGLALRHGTDVVCGISVSGQLSGPTPWHARGSASLDILFFSISIDFDVTWGGDGPAQIEQTADVLSLVKAAVQDDRNWVATIPANTHATVTLRTTNEPVDKVLLHPFGVLAVSQKIVPLGIEINKFGNQQPTGATTFDLTFTGSGTSEVREEFALANFLNMSDSDKLARKSFESLRSGLSFSDSDSSTYGANVQKQVDYELSYVHRKKNVTLKGGRFGILGSIFSMFSKAGAITKNSYSVSKFNGATPPSAIETGDPQFLVVNAADLSLHATGMVAKTSTEAYAMQAQLLAGDPSLRGKVLVVSSHELD
jgi:hypothetical protein